MIELAPKNYPLEAYKNAAIEFLIKYDGEIEAEQFINTLIGRFLLNREQSGENIILIREYVCKALNAWVEKGAVRRWMVGVKTFYMYEPEETAAPRYNFDSHSLYLENILFQRTILANPSLEFEFIKG